ncbi:hypothetical protein BJ138DRAFT_143157 [Hygrophoropsis aurantiaca]|uniref:Uncharacterized protein n=1 Tax=Hygrophoropsis aurantiaca TaxID=72124 RepID=A0ACB8AAM2_9AGAM|nr:hypothetical protein BJ138DRAFT_143157 [Hygrophoropsis aurantiaca]
MTPLSAHPLFNVRVEHLTLDERVAISYKRAKLMLDAYALTASDVLHCSQKFWELQNDPILASDVACYTILAAHVGLTIGTVAKYAQDRKDLQPLVERLLRFQIVGVFLLSERGHGLDAFNIETTATLNEHGFLLNTPREEAAKWMPATTPSFGICKVAVVMARLIVSGGDRGVRPFLVPICDTEQMCSGVTSIRLPPRTGTSPLDFAITTFHNLQLPYTALLSTTLEAPADPLQAWWNEVWRIPIGTAAVAGPLIQAVKHAAYIGGQYSLHRVVWGKGPAPVPIITFRTQQWPVLQAVACALVLDNWFPHIVTEVMDTSLDPRIRHGLAVILKTVAGRLSQLCIREITERCGAQGTFEHNSMARLEADGRGVIIAEGDVLPLCIRLFTELLLNRYTIPTPTQTKSILWQRAVSNLEACRRVLHQIPGGHRSEEYNKLLPLAEPSIAALGHALAYSAAIDSHLPEPITSMFECVVSRLGRAPSIKQCVQEDAAISRALPLLEEYLSQLNVRQYITAPILTDQRWKGYLKSLSTSHGNAEGDKIVWENTKARL